MYMKRLVYFICFCLLIFLTSGCTLIGYGVGSIIDANKSGEYYTINEEIFEISLETEIQIITVTNDTLKGLYKNTTNKYSDDYIAEYNDKYDNLKKQFDIPEINDTLSISNPMGNIFNYIFLGFDYNKIYIRSVQSGKELFITLNPDVKIKLNDGKYLNQYNVDNAFEYRLLPIMSQLHFENKSIPDSVFYHKIQKIETYDKKYKNMVYDNWCSN